MSAYFDSYQCFDDEKKADEIVHEAIEKLKAEMTDQAKALVLEYAMAKAQKDRLESDIKKLKEEVADLKAHYQRLNQFDLPKEYVQNMVKAITGDYAPGDKVWVIKGEKVQEICPNCSGAGEIDIRYCDNGKTDRIKCPKCNGRGKKTFVKRHCEETRVLNVNVKLDFYSDNVRYWTTDTLVIRGIEYPVSIDKVYPTVEAAQKAIKEMDEMEKNHELD